MKRGHINWTAHHAMSYTKINEVRSTAGLYQVWGFIYAGIFCVSGVVLLVLNEIHT